MCISPVVVCVTLFAVQLDGLVVQVNGRGPLAEVVQFVAFGSLSLGKHLDILLLFNRYPLWRNTPNPSSPPSLWALEPPWVRCNWDKCTLALLGCFGIGKGIEHSR